MNATDHPAPELRIGDFERQAAASQLQQHFAAGRISWDELDERLGAAYAGRTRADLDKLFTDLPMLAPPQAVQAPAPQPTSQPYRMADFRRNLSVSPQSIWLLVLAIGLTAVTQGATFPLIILWWVFASGAHRRVHFGNPYARGGSRHHQVRPPLGPQHDHWHDRSQHRRREF
jgi:hypothetical protein